MENERVRVTTDLLSIPFTPRECWVLWEHKDQPPDIQGPYPAIALIVRKDQYATEAGLVFSHRTAGKWAADVYMMEPTKAEDVIEDRFGDMDDIITAYIAILPDDLGDWETCFVPSTRVYFSLPAALHAASERTPKAAAV